jgi:Tfp pilus assembly protein PilN
MIKLNFIPEQQRRQSVGIVGEEFGGVPGEVIVGVLTAVAAFFIFMHITFAGVAVYKLTAHKILEARWNSMAADKKVCTEVADELKGIQAKMNAVRPITSVQQIRWAKFLNELSDSIPKGVWLREILFEKGTMAIYGSSVSKMQTEMVEAGNFVAALKERSSIKEAFGGVDIDSIQSRENSPVAVADFTLKAKRK